MMPPQFPSVPLTIVNDPTIWRYTQCAIYLNPNKIYYYVKHISAFPYFIRLLQFNAWASLRSAYITPKHVPLRYLHFF
jgi:hypothetical protein